MTLALKNCLMCEKPFRGSTGRRYCSDACRAKRAGANVLQQHEAPMSPAQVDAFLDAAVRREHAMPWERAK